MSAGGSVGRLYFKLTHPCGLDSINPHVYKLKETGGYRGIHTFRIFAPKHRPWVGRFSRREPIQLFENYRNVSSENCKFLALYCIGVLHVHVLVRHQRCR